MTNPPIQELWIVEFRWRERKKDKWSEWLVFAGKFMTAPTTLADSPTCQQRAVKFIREVPHD